MFPASLFPELAPLPFHVQFMYAVVVSSGILCLAVLAAGILRAWRSRTESADGLPPIPSVFPTALDQLYTILFMVFILWGALTNLTTVQPEAEETTFGWQLFLLGLAAQAGIYLPMLVRYALLHPFHSPTQPWWHYPAQALLCLFCIYLAVGALELSGFSSWLVHTTECPEYQELIEIFNDGEPLQRLYIAVCAVLVAPVAEECCFRGFLYPTLKRWGGCVAATIASAILFGAIHGSLAQMLPLTIFGIAQCIAYEKARSLWLPIAVHMLFNTASLIATSVMLS